MIIAFWLTTLLLCALSLGLLLVLIGESLNRGLRLTQLWQALRQRLRPAQKPRHKPRYPVDLWVWETASDTEVCDACRERASWPPMDIVEWIKQGLPRTPECDTDCGENCRCEVVPYKPRYLNERHPQH